MNRLTKRISDAKKTKQKLFCGFLTTGFPSLNATEKLIKGFDQNGVDILELAYPFSDPLADGPIIQNSSEKALAKKVKMNDCFRMVKRLRKKGVEMPILFFSYFNPIHHRGFKKFVKELKESGMDGLICPDLPVGSEEVLDGLLKKAGLSFVRLIAPNTKRDRRKQILKKTKDFVYYVSRKGITGFRKSLASNLKAEVRSLKRVNPKAVLVGFGVSNPKHVKDVCSVADGVIVGSAIIDKLDKTKSVPKTLSYIKSLMRPIRQGA